jgi:ABC-2 type transport system permease protein
LTDGGGTITQTGAIPDFTPGRFAYLRHQYTMELRRLVAYRVDFWLKFLVTLGANVAIAWFLWRSIFDTLGVDSMQGYTFKGLVLYYVLVPLVEAISRGYESMEASSDIYQGGLTRYLVYPIPYFPAEFVRASAGATVAAAQLVIVLLIWRSLSPFPEEAPLTVLTVLLGLLAAFWMSILNFLLAACLGQVAFWIDNAWNLSVMVMFIVRLLGGAMLPLALLPESAQRILEWTPFPYLISFPIKALMGQLSAHDWLFGLAVSAGWMVILGWLMFLIWERGRRRYTGVGM